MNKNQEIKLEDIVEIALSAGEKIMSVYAGDHKIEYKGDKSPLTEADRLSNETINSELNRLYPDIPVLSEENKNAEYETRKKWNTLWIVDPLDGTKEYIKKNGEFTVNIALVKAGNPVLGVVYAPAKKLLYYADKKGAYKISDASKPEKLPTGKKEGNYVVVASRSHMNDETKKIINNLERIHGKIDLISTGSSLKICLVAEGLADIYPRIAPTMEWDTAAAHAIANAAGKKVLIYSTEKELSYNKQDLLNPSFTVQ
ncbi:MAG: 3'(2'),5'-bisphosphate nucleotidase CysQ [Candidatus Altiarchaeota archaeon]|nr:3'(2'),5'-bisphosphate nucleotidase CysQ [Candidatus Altiarchaeota archaeon]